MCVPCDSYLLSEPTSGGYLLFAAHARVVRNAVPCTLKNRALHLVQLPNSGSLGPVNTYFAPALLHKKAKARREVQASKPMAKLRNAASTFFVHNPKGRDGFHPALRYSPLTEACSAARLMPRAG